MEGYKQEALDLLRARLPESAANQLEDLVQRAGLRAHQDWERMKDGLPAEHQPAPRVEGAEGPGEAEGFVGISRVLSPAEGFLRNEPDEMGRDITARTMSSPHLQREVRLLLEVHDVEDLGVALANSDDRQARKLKELLDPGVQHDWLWSVDCRQGSRMSEEDFLLAVKNRLGAEIAPAGASCQLCGEPLDAACSHGLCCAKAEATRGHYAVVGALCDGVAAVDPSVQTEVHGLLPTGERPADILTSAVIPGFKAACDVTIAAPDAKAAGQDCCKTAYRRKMVRYRPHFPALRRAGIIFRPVVWSAEGRPHPSTTRLIEGVLRLYRNQKGAVAASDLRVKWYHEIGIALQRRKAAMLRACLPQGSRRQAWMQGRTGGTSGIPLPSLPSGEMECGAAS